MRRRWEPRSSSSSSARPPRSGTPRSTRASPPSATWPAPRGSPSTTPRTRPTSPPQPLEEYDAVVFLSTTGDVLNAEQQAAFEAYIQGGGGFAGIHSASDTEYDWPWYGDLVGAYFENHPANQDATVKVSDDDHPSTAHLPERWERFDEWYNFQSNPRGDVHVLATLDETSYDPGAGEMGVDHPTAWCHPYDGGRSWYTGGGHTEESYDEPEFREHILGGIQWAAGLVEGECGGTIWDNFQKTTLAAGGVRSR